MDDRKKGGTLLYLGWIVAAFLCGVLLTLWRAGRPKKPTLRQRFSVIDRYEGRLYDDILFQMQAVPQRALCTAQGLTRRTWSEMGYCITLIFDKNNICLGVDEERFKT